MCLGLCPPCGWLADAIINSHLLVLSCNPFWDANSWTRLIYLSRQFRELVTVLISSAWADAPRNWPAKSVVCSIFSISCSNGSMTSRKRIGESTEPCMTPRCSVKEGERMPSSWTWHCGPLYHFQINLQSFAFISMS